MSFGVYVHIPYCRQMCPYCDFSKYKLGSTLAPAIYVDALKNEIRSRASHVQRVLQAPGEVCSIYFGGGTPSAIAPDLILSVLDELANAGFARGRSCEITLEIDPETIDASKLRAYQNMGFNRFSVGAQSFNDRMLKIAGRQHDGRGAMRALDLLAQSSVNYSFDLLFALPSQTLAEATLDARTAMQFAPAHLSAYCLTVPEGHPMAKGRAPDDEQVEMFAAIEAELGSAGLARYEISNFARPGRESKHNILYWTDQPYWGIGVGAHSYLPLGLYGARFWNSPSIEPYVREFNSLAIREPFTFDSRLPTDRIERLLRHQSLTDFCHTALRLTVGLSETDVLTKYGQRILHVVRKRLIGGREKGWLENWPGKLGEARWGLTERGKLLANLVFELVLFSADDLSESA